jgi:hypothetical protein
MDLTALQQRINSRHDELITELKALDKLWIQEPISGQVRDPTLLRRLEDLYRLFSYFSRWSSQLQERLVQLSF